MASSEDVRLLMERLESMETDSEEEEHGVPTHLGQESGSWMGHPEGISLPDLQERHRARMAQTTASSSTEGVVGCRQCALLQEVLHFNFPGDPRNALDEFEVLLRRYAALSGEELGENLKVALVQKGTTDEALKTHLVLHASRLTTFAEVREAPTGRHRRRIGSWLTQALACTSAQPPTPQSTR